MWEFTQPKPANQQQACCRLVTLQSLNRYQHPFASHTPALMQVAIVNQLNASLLSRLFIDASCFSNYQVASSLLFTDLDFMQRRNPARYSGRRHRAETVQGINSIVPLSSSTCPSILCN